MSFPLSLDSWSAALRHFGESFAVALDLTKAFSKVWHKALISKILSLGIYPPHCGLLSDFLSGRSIATVVDCHRSSFKYINNCVPQGSVLSLTLFPLFINGLLSVTSSSIYCYADDYTLHDSFSIWNAPLPTAVNCYLIVTRKVTMEQLTSDSSRISN